MKLGKLILALPFCLFIFGNTIAYANTAGQVSFTQGQVTAINSKDQIRDLTRGSDIFANDDINTGANARAQLQFTDGGSISLMANTQFSVDEYLYNDDGSGSLVFNLISGGLRTVTGAIGKKQHADYELKTPVGTLGIRGTEYTAKMRSLDQLLVHVGRGKVVLSNSWGSIDVDEGESAIMTLDSAPVTVDANLDTLNNDPDLQDHNLPKPDPELDPDFGLNKEADSYFGQPEDIDPENGGEYETGQENDDFGNDDFNEDFNEDFGKDDLNDDIGNGQGAGNNGDNGGDDELIAI